MNIEGKMMSPREAVVESMLVTVFAAKNSSVFRTKKYNEAVQTVIF
jgi:hypothetical protein